MKNFVISFALSAQNELVLKQALLAKEKDLKYTVENFLDHKGFSRFGFISYGKAIILLKQALNGYIDKFLEIDDNVFSFSYYLDDNYVIELEEGFHGNVEAQYNPLLKQIHIDYQSPVANFQIIVSRGGEFK